MSSAVLPRLYVALVGVQPCSYAHHPIGFAQSRTRNAPLRLGVLSSFLFLTYIMNAASSLLDALKVLAVVGLFSYTILFLPDAGDWFMSPEHSTTSAVHSVTDSAVVDDHDRSAQ